MLKPVPILYIIKFVQAALAQTISKTRNMKKIKNNALQINLAKDLLNSLTILIDKSRKNIAITVNREITLLYWQIGKSISIYLLDNKRAEYGEKIIATVSQQLTAKYGSDFTKSNRNLTKKGAYLY